jgi:hypothetical protein
MHLRFCLQAYVLRFCCRSSAGFFATACKRMPCVFCSRSSTGFFAGLYQEDREATAVTRLKLAGETRGVVIVSVVPFLPPPPPATFGLESLDCPDPPECICDCDSENMP